ncbi:MAG: GTP-binding protein Era [Labilithrix sp.]|nr:GTP-binding protein Era [Labilithrix sp.]
MASKKKGAGPGRSGRAAAPVTTRAGTIALVGRPNVGKSTLLNALLSERIAIVSHHAQTTRDRIAGILTKDGTQFVFLDTPGFHRARHKLGEHMNEVARAAAAECDVAIFVTEPVMVKGEIGADVSAAVREDDRALLAAIPASTKVVLVLNKIDKVKKKQALMPLLEALGKERELAAVIPVSALRADGMAHILGEVAALLPEGEWLYEEDELSDKPVRFFVSEFVREQILRRTRQEIPHGVAVTVESFDEGAKLVRIAVIIHVAKDSHKGIIIGDGGAMLQAVGSAARKRAEELLGRKVHLETFVRSTPNWFDDDARLADMGYAGEAGQKKIKKPKTKKDVS